MFAFHRPRRKFNGLCCLPFSCRWDSLSGWMQMYSHRSSLSQCSKAKVRLGTSPRTLLTWILCQSPVASRTRLLPLLVGFLWIPAANSSRRSLFQAFRASYAHNSGSHMNWRRELFFRYCGKPGVIDKYTKLKMVVLFNRWFMAVWAYRSKVRAIISFFLTVSGKMNPFLTKGLSW